MKKLKKINIFIIIIMILFAFSICLFNLLKGEITIGLKALIIIPIILIPSIIRKIFKVKFKYIIETILILFMFFAYYLGYVFGIYDVIDGYDKIIHTISGVVASFIAIFILKAVDKYCDKNKWFNILFCICFALTTGVFWEFVEFGGDKFFGKNDQSVETGVDDTMYDLLVAFLGSFIFCLCYYYEITFHKQFIIKKYIKYLN